jgi:hypothetical protein
MAKQRRKIETDADMSNACEELMQVVARVAGHRLLMILEAATDMARKPVLEENAALLDEVKRLRKMVGEMG